MGQLRQRQAKMFWSNRGEQAQTVAKPRLTIRKDLLSDWVLSGKHCYDCSEAKHGAKNHLNKTGYKKKPDESISKADDYLC